MPYSKVGSVKAFDLGKQNTKRRELSTGRPKKDPEIIIDEQTCPKLLKVPEI